MVHSNARMLGVVSHGRTSTPIFETWTLGAWGAIGKNKIGDFPKHSVHIYIYIYLQFLSLFRGLIPSGWPRLPGITADSNGKRENKRSWMINVWSQHQSEHNFTEKNSFQLYTYTLPCCPAFADVSLAEHLISTLGRGAPWMHAADGPAS